eukprot:jgi/Bigna1/74118/fgenesh1_pg.27_\
MPVARYSLQEMVQLGDVVGRAMEGHVILQVLGAFISRQQNLNRKRRRDRSFATQMRSIEVRRSVELGLSPAIRVTGSPESLHKIPTWKSFYLSTPYLAAVLEPWMLDLVLIEPNEPPQHEITREGGDTKGGFMNDDSAASPPPPPTPSSISHSSILSSKEERKLGRVKRMQDFVVCLREVWLEYDGIVSQTSVTTEKKKEEDKEEQNDRFPFSSSRVKLSFAIPRPHEINLNIPSTSCNCRQSSSGATLHKHSSCVCIVCGEGNNDNLKYGNDEERCSSKQISSYMRKKTRRFMIPLLYLIGYGESLRKFSNTIRRLRLAARRRNEQLEMRGEMKEALD